MTALERIEEERIKKTGKLDLRKCKLTELPNELFELTHLQSLNLSANQISDIRFLEKLTSLQFLYINRNQISDYSFLEKWRYLRKRRE